MRGFIGILGAITAALSANVHDYKHKPIVVPRATGNERLWPRACPTGQGRNAKQRRAQRKARHIKRIRSYKR